MQPPLEEPSREGIWEMFDQISPTYDRVNRLMTFGLDRYWRRKVGRFLPEREKMTILDCATGTGDQMLSLVKNHPAIEQAIGIDLAKEMLEIGKKKAFLLGQKVSFQEASALDLPFEHHCFDAVTISFGIRNVTDRMLCLHEMFRVLKPGGRAIILECSIPENRLLKALYLFYFRHLLPRLGGWISKKPAAYQYLNKTAELFPSGKVFCDLLDQAGFIKHKAHPMTFGTVSIYVGEKPE
jgi:demethylmenaquinone methyltransferase/2-methoxy-6-polyprenyl-1,4-benzoquinol methylase